MVTFLIQVSAMDGKMVILAYRFVDDVARAAYFVDFASRLVYESEITFDGNRDLLLLHASAISPDDSFYVWG